MISAVGDASEFAFKDFTLFDGEIFVQIEHCLFPVSVLIKWAGCEAGSLVAFGEFNIKPGHECLDVIISLDLHLEINGKFQVFGRNRVEIKVQQQRLVSDDLVAINTIDQWFLHCQTANDAHVEAVYFFPP